MIGLGVVTYNRPEMCERTLKAVTRNCKVDRLYVHDDGSSPKFNAAYRRALKCVPEAVVTGTTENRGVAQAKNVLLRRMISDGCHWMILCEDDILPINKNVVEGYVGTAEHAGLGHLSFAHHGPANVGSHVEVEGPVTFYQHSIGAWGLYSAAALKKVGLFDEGFTNAWEHVEHSLRLAQAGFGGGPYRWPDATDSPLWLVEQRGSIEKSVIRPRSDWNLNVVRGLDYWKRTKPETYKLMFGPETPLHDWAERLVSA